jgi:hypothetical protein
MTEREPILSLGSDSAVPDSGASCIAVSLETRNALPDAGHGLSTVASLAGTVPFNALAGIPLHEADAGWPGAPAG